MTQTRLGSLIEAIVNVMIGFCISLVVGYFVFPWFGWHISMSTNLQVTMVFTVTSILRSYLLRRFFNARLHGISQTLAEKFQ